MLIFVCTPYLHTYWKMYVSIGIPEAYVLKIIDYSKAKTTQMQAGQLYGWKMCLVIELIP